MSCSECKAYGGICPCCSKDEDELDIGLIRCEHCYKYVWERDTIDYNDARVCPACVEALQAEKEAEDLENQINNLI